MIKVKGFMGNGIASGIKRSGRKDLAVIFAEKPAQAAAVFTKNVVKGAPVVLGMERIKSGLCQALLINSGVANTHTGRDGVKRAVRTSKYLSLELGINEELVIPSSTGIIGGRLPVEKIKKSIPRLVSGMNENRLQHVAEAIMTTDKFPKSASRNINVGGRKGTIAAVAKGAGMICPDMATMLCFIMTDIDITRNALNKSLIRSSELSFNRAIVDGDTSTNDSVFLLSSGLAGNRTIEEESKDYDKFTGALTDLSTELAEMMVKDGEGATKVVKILVKGADSSGDAEKVARTVGSSLLVKTAFFGEDPNWGRLIAAAGRAGVSFDPERVEILFDRIKVVKDGKQCKDESRYQHIFRNPEFTVTLDLNQGSSESFVITSDLTFEYVKINSHYRT